MVTAMAGHKTSDQKNFSIFNLAETKPYCIENASLA